MAERSQPVLRLSSFDEIPQRGRVAGEGHIRSVTIVPASQAPSFSVLVEETEDPSGSARRGGRKPELRLVWLGRRRLSGVTAGTPLRFEGMVAQRDGVATIYNPRYEILAKED